MILEQAKKTIRAYGLLSANDKVVIGVSGGPDSVALAYLLCSLKKEYKLNLHLAHLDHMLRKDSAKDAEFAAGLADALKIPFTLGRADLRGLKKSSPEERARNARLNFLFRVARKTGAGKIALGHNLDDQAETVLMRILRGTGLYGLAAILPKREISGFQIIRPLLEVSRKEIEAFLRRKKIRTRLDPTNLQDIYFRNKIRNKLLPLLRKDYNKNIKEVLANMAQSSGYDYDYLQRKASAMLKARNTRIPSKRLIRLHPAIRRLVIRQAIARVKGDTRRITFRHILEVEDLTFNRPVNSIVDMPKGISVKKDKNNLVFYRRRRRSYS